MGAPKAPASVQRTSGPGTRRPRGDTRIPPDSLAQLRVHQDTCPRETELRNAAEPWWPPADSTRRHTGVPRRRKRMRSGCAGLGCPVRICTGIARARSGAELRGGHARMLLEYVGLTCASIEDSK